MENDWDVNDPAASLEALQKRSPWVQATMIDADGEWLDLLCPKCACNRITCQDGKPDLGNWARCYECGFKFTITGNCWKRNPEMCDKYDA